jgi:large subunit ribosomal protein L18
MRKTDLGPIRKNNPKEGARLKRKTSIKKRIQTDSDLPRLSVFRSARHIYAQVIDDTKHATVVSASTVEKAVRDAMKGKKKADQAKEIGKAIAERAKKAGIVSCVFDRNGFRYHGRVAAVADGARVCRWKRRLTWGL